MASLDNDFEALDQLMPMHVVVDPQGCITHTGPTMSKLVGAECLGSPFLQCFKVVKPSVEASASDLSALCGRSLVVELGLDAPVTLKAHCVQLGEATIVDMSFGFSVAEAVRRFNLTRADFAPTDQAIGMLYLSEAYALSLGEFRNLSLRQEGAKRLAEIEAHTDPLTGLFNRRGLDAAMREVQQSGQDFAVMQIDLDHFKAVNDGLGHAAGDAVLVRVAEVLVSETRKQDLVARNGGDEFTVILTDVSDIAVAEDIGGRIVERIKQPMQLPQGDCRISASVGTAFSHSFDETNVDALIELADASLYKSKSSGRGRQTLHV